MSTPSDPNGNGEQGGNSVPSVKKEAGADAVEVPGQNEMDAEAFERWVDKLAHEADQVPEPYDQPEFTAHLKKPPVQQLADALAREVIRACEIHAKESLTSGRDRYHQGAIDMAKHLRKWTRGFVRRLNAEQAPSVQGGNDKV